MPKKKVRLTHLDQRGQAHMVDVGEKPATARAATAEAFVVMKAATLKLLRSGVAKKGDVLAVARVAGIQAAKRTPEWIPLCHGLVLNSVSVNFSFRDARTLRIEAAVRCTGPTGVEMEALVAAAAAALTVYDMLKAADRGMEIGPLRLLSKSGGRSGAWVRKRVAAE